MAVAADEDGQRGIAYSGGHGLRRVAVATSRNEPGQQRLGDEVEHDRGDHLVGAENALRKPGMKPHRAPTAAPARMATGMAMKGPLSLTS